MGDPALVNEDLSIVERRKGLPHLIDSIQRRGSVIVTPMETERAAHIGNSVEVIQDERAVIGKPRLDATFGGSNKSEWGAGNTGAGWSRSLDLPG